MTAERGVLVSVASAHSAQKRQVQHMLREAGLKGVRCDGIAAVYRLEGPAAEAEAPKIARELLCDAVVETYGVDSKPARRGEVFADVWYKPGVTDTVADSLIRAIADLGVSGVSRASSGLRYVFSGKAAKSGPFEKSVLEFASKELLNPLVQECKLVKP